ncbi:MAG: glycoside hydrolase family 172 protein, partial [Terriglobia bacterium]
MHSDDKFLPQRRKFISSPLTLGLASAGVLGLASARADAAPRPSESGLAYPEEISLALLRDYQTAKASSYDRTGGNADAFPIEPGATQVLMDVQGPGMVSHIWFTISAQDPRHLKKLILRMYWDGESEPSVEVPVGDFFGLNLGEYFMYQSALLTVAAVKALNAYFPMPFRKSALITVTNECEKRVGAYYSNIDYQILSRLPENIGYFHAQYRQTVPCPGWSTAVDKNLDGKSNYVFMEATGRGHLVGVTQGIVLNQDGWWG